MQSSIISRRGVLKAGLFLGAGFALDGLVLEPRDFRIERHTVFVRGLGPEFSGFTICQITDVHHSRIISLGYLETVVSAANALRPDLTVLTGDYIDADRNRMAPAIKCLSGLKAGHGIVAILGNHDYFFGRQYTEDVIAANRLPLLKDAHIIIERGSSALCIAGTRDFSEDRPDVKKAFKGVDESIPRVLLTHHPDHCEHLPHDERIDLVLSGHTHGGQIRLPFYAPILPSNYGQKYSGGFVRLTKPDGALAYVSRGIGMAMLPIRFNCPPELTLIRLEPARADATRTEAKAGPWRG